MFFYLVFCLFLGFSRSLALMGMTALMISLVAIGQFFGFDLTALRFWTSPLLLEFLIGVWIGVVACRCQIKKPSWMVFSSIVMLSLWVLWAGENIDLGVGDVPEVVLQGLPCAVIVFAFAVLLPKNAENRIPKIIAAFGDSSYALYLSHRFPLRLATLAWQKIFGSGGGSWAGVFVFLAVVTCMVVGHLVWFCLERPLTSFLMRRRGGYFGALNQKSVAAQGVP